MKEISREDLEKRIEVLEKKVLEKRIEVLEKKVAELEGRVQEQPNIEEIIKKINNEFFKAANKII